MSVFKGSGVAIVTPFLNGKIDYKSMEKLIEYQISNGTDAIIVCGTTGEASTLSYEEQIECIKRCVEIVKGRVKVIAGSGSNCTKSAVNLSKTIEKLGVDALLVVTPYYNKATQEGLKQHYKMINDNVSIPVIMYNVPSRTGVNIEPSTAIEIAKNNKNIVGIKEASGNISQISELSYLKSKYNVNLDIYSGNDNQVLPILALGGIGVISVNANVIPKDMHNLVTSYLNHDFKKSSLLNEKAILYSNILFCEVNPIPVKTALYELGLIASDELRLPLTKMDEKNVKKLKKIIRS
jgi:4-hydroxy-tetrahydrodipicolinate synthase